MIAFVLGDIKVSILCRADGNMFAEAVLTYYNTAGMYAGLPDTPFQHLGKLECLGNQRFL